MTKQAQEAYIVAATRTPVGKAPRGMFRNTLPDDLLAQAPALDPAAVALAADRIRLGEATAVINFLTISQ